MNMEGRKLSRRNFVSGAIASPALLRAGDAVAAQTGAQAAARRADPPTIFKDDFGAIAGWRRHGVIMQKDLAWESSLLQDPCLVYATGDGARFKMWYGSLTNIGYATSDDGLRWSKRADPVIMQTLPSEARALNQPSVVFKDGVYHMTYFGVSEDGEGQVHYARATRPEGPWTKGGVVLTSTARWEDRFVYNSSLLYDEEERIWKIWYTAGKIKSAGGEPRYICYATAADPAGPWSKHPSNPILRPMDDGGWASKGVGGPNVRKLGPNLYETRIVGWQADYPSRGGRLTSPDGLRWRLDRAAMELDLGVAGGPEDSMIYRQFVVEHGGRKFCFYNAKNNRPGWNETINLATWEDGLNIVNPSLWTMGQGAAIPTGASFEVRDGAAFSLGNAEKNPQTLQGNRLIDRRDYSVQATISAGPASNDREHVILARYTDRDNYYLAGIGAWGHRYGIGVVEDGQSRMLAGVGSVAEIRQGEPHALTFELRGHQLRLLDGGREVLSVADPTLLPEASYVGLQTTNPDGRGRFARVRVEALTS
ncbi:hypothetical protein [Sphingomonas sp. BK580]|uniref:hypothetical protein n=1 Tax=Sphingomonas sp. BK580 TaxID=2586972 RepID=UPI00160E87EE|nr:hypothetical protein [Sphingomonas sp. BK580]MBB3695241.1 hypothetical protein [Sphingomonas sp. BK580]